MKNEKSIFPNIEESLSREEMKSVMAGSTSTGDCTYYINYKGWDCNNPYGSCGGSGGPYGETSCEIECTNGHRIYCDGL